MDIDLKAEQAREKIKSNKAWNRAFVRADKKVMEARESRKGKRSK